jgi:hypothetical protein
LLGGGHAKGALASRLLARPVLACFRRNIGILPIFALLGGGHAKGALASRLLARPVLTCFRRNIGILPIFALLGGAASCDSRSNASLREEARSASDGSAGDTPRGAAVAG